MHTELNLWSGFIQWMLGSAMIWWVIAILVKWVVNEKVTLVQVLIDHMKFIRGLAGRVW